MEEKESLAEVSGGSGARGADSAAASSNGSGKGMSGKARRRDKRLRNEPKSVLGL